MAILTQTTAGSYQWWAHMVSRDPPSPPILSFKKTCKILKIKQNKPCRFIQTEVSVSWRDGAAIKSACAPPKELQFSSHHPLVKPSVTLVLGIPVTLVSSGTCTCVHIPRYRYFHLHTVTDNEHHLTERWCSAREPGDRTEGSECSSSNSRRGIWGFSALSSLSSQHKIQGK